MKSRNYTLCGTPKEECSGAMLAVPWGTVKAHSDPVSAFKCQKRHLIASGYKEVGMRELVSPETGAIRLLTKPSHFGGPIRGGKRGDKEGASVAGKRGVYSTPYTCGGGVACY